MSATIQLRCPKCKKEKSVSRQKDDPKIATRVDIQCPECNGGDFDTPIYFDADGMEVAQGSKP